MNRLFIRLFVLIVTAIHLSSGHTIAAPSGVSASESKYLTVVRRTVDVILENGRDTHGDQHSEMIISVLDRKNGKPLHRLPQPRPGEVLGLVGSNGTGKSTALRILSGNIKPNLGRYESTNEPEWKEILKFFRGSDLQNFFTKMLEEKMKALIKI